MFKLKKKLPIISATLLAASFVAGGAILSSGCAQTPTAQSSAHPAADTAKSPVHFFENFRNYHTKAPTVVDDSGLTVSNEAIFARMASINVNMSQSGLLLREYSPASVPANLKNYDVLFRFRLQESDGKLGHFQLRMRNGQKSNAGEVIVGISTDEVKISSEGLNPAVNSSSKLSFTLDKNQWHQAAVTVRNGQLTVYIDDNRALQSVAQAKVPALPSAGINFYAYQGSRFNLTDITLRDPAPLPNNAIGNILPTPLPVNEADFKHGVTQTVAANDIFGATIRTGLEPAAVKLTINNNDGTSREITFTTLPIADQRKVTTNGKTVTEKFDRPDALIRITGLADARSSLDYYIRPMLRRYHSSYSFTDTYYDIVRDWDLLPKASEHPLKVEFRRTASGADLFLDGSYAASVESAGIKDIAFALAPTASLAEVVSQKRAYDAQKYVPLDIASQRMAKSFFNTSTSIKTGFSKVNSIPMFVTSGAGSADVGLIREGQGDWALEVDEYLARSPFDGLLTEVHATVPGGAPFTKAWVLAAIDPDPSKDPVLTVRVTHYEEPGIGQNLIADTTVTLPRGNEKPAAGVTQVGTVSGVDASGKKINLPLYLVEVQINSGKILDVYDHKSLNIDFLGKLGENMQQRDFSMKPDPKSTSAVQIFGTTMERGPITLDMVQSQPGNVFVEGETPATGLMIKSFEPAQGQITWEMFDVDDQKVGNGSADYIFAKAGQEKQLTIPLKMKELGWYRLIISAKDQNGNNLFTHRGSFALLGKDTRQAKYDSPYATWWWDGTHMTTKDVEFDGPLMFKAGIRKASASSRSEAELAKWFITRPQHRKQFNFGDLNDPQKALEKHEASLRAEIKKYPHTREILIFHENSPGSDVPAELLGEQPEEPSPEELPRVKRYADLVNLAGPFYREKFPQLKLVVGNSGISHSTITAVLRHGGNPDFIDYVGIEATGQSYIPEKLSEVSIPGSYIAKDIAETLSGRDIPITGSFEFVSRSQRDLGPEQQAQWYIRDVLISLTNDFTIISPGTLSDASNNYFNTYWGAGGMLERRPYGYPKKAYVAYATLTKVFDQVKFSRQVPTGSTTVYAAEFNRADKKLATALWASRGDVDFNLTFAADTTVNVVEMYGPTRELKTTGGKLTVRAGVRPTYLVTDKEIKAITLSNRSFPQDEAIAKLAKVAAPLDNLAAVTIDNDDQLDSNSHPMLIPVRKLGAFDLRQVKDEQKGNVLELKLDTSKNQGLSKYVTEYTTLRLKNPVTIQGEPAALGVWIKGNSNWGRVLYEIEDAQGEVWRSTGTIGWGCDIVDWPGHTSVNFDGWNFLSFPLRDSSLFTDHSPGPMLEQWISTGGNKQIEYPIKLRALIVEMNRTPLGLVDFKAGNSVIRIKDVSGIYKK